MSNIQSQEQVRFEKMDSLCRVPMVYSDFVSANLSTEHIVCSYSFQNKRLILSAGVDAAQDFDLVYEGKLVDSKLKIPVTIAADMGLKEGTEVQLSRCGDAIHICNLNQRLYLENPPLIIQRSVDEFMQIVIPKDMLMFLEMHPQKLAMCYQQSTKTMRFFKYDPESAEDKIVLDELNRFTIPNFIVWDMSLKAKDRVNIIPSFQYGTFSVQKFVQEPLGV